MRQSTRLLIGVALLLPLLAGIAFFAVQGSGEVKHTAPAASSRLSSPPARTHRAEEASATSTAQEVVPSETQGPAPGEFAQPDSPEEFKQPDSPEEYWRELEDLQRTDKARALAYALQGDEWYPDTGKPAEARRAMIITLQVDLGQMSEARERTRDFIKLYPGSPYRPLIQGATGIHPRPGAPPGHQR